MLTFPCIICVWLPVFFVFCLSVCVCLFHRHEIKPQEHRWCFCQPTIVRNAILSETSCAGVNSNTEYSSPPCSQSA